MLDEAVIESRLQHLKEAGIIAILRGKNPERMYERGMALAQMGCRAIEVTLDSPRALEIVEALRPNLYDPVEGTTIAEAEVTRLQRRTRLLDVCWSPVNGGNDVIIATTLLGIDEGASAGAQVRAGTESPACTGDDHRRHLVSSGCPCQCSIKLLAERAVPCVQRIGPVQGDDRDATIYLDEYFIHNG